MVTSALHWEKKISNLLAQGSWKKSLGGEITYVANLGRIVRQIILLVNEVRGAGKTDGKKKKIACMGQVALTICKP